jgi:hypothetical protein
MVVGVKPKSHQSGGKNTRYKEQLGASARAHGAKVLSGPLYARIIWFQLEQTPGDVDNMTKPILDALRGVVYQDDDQIVRRLTEKTVTSSRSFSMTPSEAPTETTQAELESLVGTEQHVLYIEVGPVTDPRISFGPVG